MDRAERAAERSARTTEQNAKFHAMCRDFAKSKLQWGGFTWNEEQWKRIFLAAKFDQAIVPNPFTHGLVIVNKKRSRDTAIDEMAELLGEMEAFGNEHGIDWSEDDEG
jgi:NinB protein